MKIKILAFIAASLMLTACEEPPVVSTKKIGETYNFDYILPIPNDLKISQVFDNKHDTFIVFSKKQESAPIVENGGGAILPVSEQGKYWRVGGVYVTLKIKVGESSVTVKNSSAQKENPEPAEVKKPVEVKKVNSKEKAVESSKEVKKGKDNSKPKADNNSKK